MYCLKSTALWALIASIHLFLLSNISSLLLLPSFNNILPSFLQIGRSQMPVLSIFPIRFLAKPFFLNYLIYILFSLLVFLVFFFQVAQDLLSYIASPYVVMLSTTALIKFLLRFSDEVFIAYYLMQLYYRSFPFNNFLWVAHWIPLQVASLGRSVWWVSNLQPTKIL